jgi:sortase A
LKLHHLRFSGAFIVPLFFVMLALAACTGPIETLSSDHDRTPSRSSAEQAVRAESKPQTTAGGQAEGGNEDGDTVKAVLPEDVLSKKDLDEPTPKYKDWYKEVSDSGGTETSDTTAGTIPAVEPFNLGRDPGGPEDKTLYLTVPGLGLEDVTAYDSASEEKLKKSLVHIPATGFPWQKGANTYIAGHRLGYEGTGSYLVFYYLDQLAEGDEILLEDSAGTTYTYRVTDQLTVDPDNVEVMEPVEGKSLVSLQTCTLPDYEQRLIVQGELVDKSG